MGHSNPPIPWLELEKKVSDRRRPGCPPADADGSDSPGWTSVRPPYSPDRRRRRQRPPDAVPYAELHCHSHYSFLDGELA